MSLCVIIHLYGIHTFLRSKRVPTVQVPLRAAGGSTGEETGPPGHPNNRTETRPNPDWGPTGQRLRRGFNRGIHRGTHGGIHRVAPIFSNLTKCCTETFSDPGRSTGSHRVSWGGETRNVSGRPGPRFWCIHLFNSIHIAHFQAKVGIAGYSWHSKLYSYNYKWGKFQISTLLFLPKWSFFLDQ